MLIPTQKKAINMSIILTHMDYSFSLQEVLMGKDEYFRSFRENADNFICSLLPGISGHPQIQYSPGNSFLHPITHGWFIHANVSTNSMPLQLQHRWPPLQGGQQ